MIALTHLPSPLMEQCQKTYITPSPIDYHLALHQHRQYCELLRQEGFEVQILDVNCEHPDCAFIEDTAIVFDEVALLGSMGVASRRGEPAGLENEISRYREVVRVDPPATIEGGDVLVVGKTLLVGSSTRTNQAGIDALATVVRRFGYQIIPVPVRHCLHLKTACTALDDTILLVNPNWIDGQLPSQFQLVNVPHDEPWAANTLRVGQRLCMAASNMQTADMIRRLGHSVREIDISEFGKAEGGVTCLSLLLK